MIKTAVGCVKNRQKFIKTAESSQELALIAVCNKLLKQAFAVVKSGLPYDENYVSKLG
ncbi:hypothetical protein [Salegentibacter flavus]|uniref:hypothetical protein n=1 Tax=Salegentibacter flavus TaxID=287099 RepID=UPI00373FCA43